jgi:hypothetical protein
MSLQNNRGESRERSEKREERKRGGRPESDEKIILTGKKIVQKKGEEIRENREES